MSADECESEGGIRKDQCPITDIVFKRKDQGNVTKPSADELSEKDYQKVPFDDHYNIWYSKTRDSLPVTNLKLATPSGPCLEPSHLSSRSKFYPAEIMKMSYCENDPRYSASGFSTNEYKLQE